MANPDRYLVLASDPEVINWTVVHQTEDADDAIDYWRDNKDDPSYRIVINTGNFISFKIPEKDDE